MNNTKSYSHISLLDRKTIQQGIENGLHKCEIAKAISRDLSTVAKEIKLRRIVKPRNLFNLESLCIHLKECHGCFNKCDRYQEPNCQRRDRFVGACNHCPNMAKCHLEKYFYNATKAHESYLYTLKDAREGFNLTTLELKRIAQTIKPLLKQKQSIYQILTNHKEISLCPKTLYTYIESGIFKEYGIDSFSLRRQVSTKRKKTKIKSRKEPVNYINRKYCDYLDFIQQFPDIPTTEMDTLYNSAKGPYIQTFSFQNTSLMIGFLHTQKTSESMANTLDILQDTLGIDYAKLFSLLLTDRGVEFEKYDLFEYNIQTNQKRSNIFYCDPQRPSQKPHVENTHNYVRDILPNGMELSKLTQEDLELIFSHINSTPRKSLGGKTPYEVFEYFYGTEILNKLKIQKIEKDKVSLQPYLLKNI